MINLLDYGALAFARAEVATLADTFDHVALATETDTLTHGEKAGGNLVVIASNAPLNVASIAAKISERGADWDVITGAELAAWTGDARGADRRLCPRRPAAHAIPERLKELLAAPHSGRLSAGPAMR